MIKVFDNFLSEVQFEQVEEIVCNPENNWQLLCHGVMEKQSLLNAIYCGLFYLQLKSHYFTGGFPPPQSWRLVIWTILNTI